MMAACLLIESGSSPPTAITAVRRARRGTIENRDQEEFVLGYKRVTPH
jgi:protein-tyrosine phosphatase